MSLDDHTRTPTASTVVCSLVDNLDRTSEQVQDKSGRSMMLTKAYEGQSQP